MCGSQFDWQSEQWESHNRQTWRIPFTVNCTDTVSSWSHIIFLPLNSSQSWWSLLIIFAVKVALHIEVIKFTTNIFKEGEAKLNFVDLAGSERLRDSQAKNYQMSFM